MRVFYSWQSDTPAKVGKAYLREALKEAIAGLDLEDAERPEIDQDTSGVLGSPVIADSIFKKIKAANVVVADVTLSGSTPTGKRLCNSNVAIELGYALGIHGDEILLKVMNTYYGLPKDLPFDLAHRRWPVQYELSPDADEKRRRNVREQLAGELRQILQLYLEASRKPTESFVRTSSTYNSAAYWQREESLLESTSRDERIRLSYEPGSALVYLRIWPAARIPELSIQLLSDPSKVAIEPLCGGINGWSWDRNRYGVITHARRASDTKLGSSTQVLRTGEVWGVNAYLLRNRDHHGGSAAYIPTVAYENGIRASLGKYIALAREHFGYPNRIFVESGLVDIADFRLAMSNTEFWGPIYENIVVKTDVDTNKPETLDAALLKIFEAVFESAGHSRPSRYNNFPT